jgi:hypothetical protein
MEGAISMREIKFRGKVLEGGWMHVTPESSSWEQFWALVDKKTLGQYTGIKDNTPWEKASQEEQRRWLKHHTQEQWKGREIYEGDVIKGILVQYLEKREEICEVKYDDIALLTPFHEVIGYDGELWIEEASYEIVGNIHDLENTDNA